MAKFKKVAEGLESTIDTQPVDQASMYIATDTKHGYIDTSQGRINIGDTKQLREDIDTARTEDIDASRVIVPSASNDGASLGVARKRSDLPLALGATMTLVRIGNVVHMFGTGTFAQTPIPTTFTTYSNRIPYGYRPFMSFRSSSTRTATNSNVGSMGVMEFQAGTPGTTTASNIRVAFETNNTTDNNFSATWITTDPATPTNNDSILIFE